MMTPTYKHSDVLPTPVLEHSDVSDSCIWSLIGDSNPWNIFVLMDKTLNRNNYLKVIQTLKNKYIDLFIRSLNEF